MVVVAMRQNLHEFPDLVRLAHRLAIDTRVRPAPLPRLRRVEPAGALPADARLRRRPRPWSARTRSGSAGTSTRRRRWRSELGVDLRLPRTRPRPHPPGTPGPERCDWPWRGAYVSYQGLAMPCCMVATPDRINFGRHGRARAPRPSGTARTTRRSATPSRPKRRPEVCRSCADLLGDVLRRPTRPARPAGGSNSNAIARSVRRCSKREIFFVAESRMVWRFVACTLSLSSSRPRRQTRMTCADLVPAKNHRAFSNRQIVRGASTTQH